MNIGFFLIGGIIFAIYIGLTFYNIFYSNKKQREENYPNLKKNFDPLSPLDSDENKNKSSK
ncbi:hypothetical protein ES692_16450 [Psychroserpens burtonensis]|uniref:Cbb3-type cytochrome c oxidase subunit 3 n=1 Tax=Psychroserpens burtonensis TaxID=49278 RepID=A0A5C7B6R1_9FLAO|nr:hypothetical protein ES692_16450 [Psychroserpens burtonensis]